MKKEHLTHLRADGQPAPAIGGTDYTSQSFNICWYIYVIQVCISVCVSIVTMTPMVAALYGIILEVVVPTSAIYQLLDTSVCHNKSILSTLTSSEAHRESLINITAGWLDCLLINNAHPKIYQPVHSLNVDIKNKCF